MMRVLHHCWFPHNIFSSAALPIGVFRYIHLVTTFSRENLILLLLQSLRADPNLNWLRRKVWTQEYSISPIYSPTWQLYIIIPVLANCYNRTTLRPSFWSEVLNIHHHPNFQLLQGSFRAIKILARHTYYIQQRRDYSPLHKNCLGASSSPVVKIIWKNMMSSRLNESKWHSTSWSSITRNNKSKIYKWEEGLAWVRQYSTSKESF